MASAAVYSSTTAPNPKTHCFLVPSQTLHWDRFGVKVLQVLLSLVAFAQEEVVWSCFSCGPLYFFEFMSCTSFLFTLLLLLLLSTSLHQRVGGPWWPIVDFWYTCCIFVLFLVSSIVFSADNGGSSLEKSAAAFGFLASLFFLLDLILVYRTRGFPWRPDQGSDQIPDRGPDRGPDPETPETEEVKSPEAERLTANGQ